MNHSTAPRSTNRRVLLACSDVTTRERIAAALRTSGIEVAEAENGDMALALFARQSFPVLISDRQIESTDGLELVQRVRALSIEPVYVMLMTSDSSGVQMERGYCAGVDQHLPRDIADSAVVDRAQAAFKAIALRRASRRMSFGENVVTVDLASGAHTARHLVGRLSAEIKLAQLGGGTLEIVLLRVQTAASDATASGEDRLTQIREAVQLAVRPHADWIACLHSIGHSHRFAVVMPDCPAGSVAALEQHVRNAFALNDSNAQTPELSFGHVTFKSSTGELPTALDLLAQADAHRRASAQPLPATASAA